MIANTDIFLQTFLRKSTWRENFFFDSHYDFYAITIYALRFTPHESRKNVCLAF
jgi:hypothetical protein